MHYDHVIVVMMENQSLSEITGGAAPYVTSLMADCGYSTNFHGATHPSVPNYIAMNSGIPVAQLPATNCTSCKQAARSIFNQVTWRAYQESMPSNCRLTKSADGLTNPATYFVVAVRRQDRRQHLRRLSVGDRPVSPVRAY